MIFGKIDYLNLLPFHLFLKRFASTTRHQMSVNYKKGVPSKINEDFLNRRVDAAFISSIKARRCRKTRLGIIAKKEVDLHSASTLSEIEILGLAAEHEFYSECLFKILTAKTRKTQVNDLTK